MSDTGINSWTLAGRPAPNGARAHIAESGEAGSDPSDRATPQHNAPGYELPGGFTAYSQTDKRETKRSATAAQTGPAQQSRHSPRLKSK